jgi:hypothetical protein
VWANQPHQRQLHGGRHDQPDLHLVLPVLKEPRGMMR